MRHATAAMILLTAMAGCSLFEEDERLPGERVKLREQEALSGSAGVIRQPVIPAQSKAEWTQTNGNAAHNSGNISGPSTLSVAWRADAGQGNSSDSSITSAPIVVNGSVITLDAAAEVRSFDVGSGNRQWDVSLAPEGENGEEGFGGGLAAEGNAIFAATGFGEVLALSAQSGEIQWRRKFNAPFRAPPAVANGIVVAVTRDNQSFAMQAATGEVVWRHQGIAADAGLLGGASPAIAGGLVALPYSSGELVGIDLGSGRPVWSAVLTGGRRGLARSSITDLTGDPVIAGPFVIAANQSGRMVAIDGRTGVRAWTRVLGAIRPPWPAGNTLFLMSDLSELTRIDLRNGDTLWSTALPAFEDEEDREDPIIYSGPILVGGRLVMTDTLGNLWSFDPVSGEGEVIEDISGGSRTGPVSAGGTVFVLGDDADLIALR